MWPSVAILEKYESPPRTRKSGGERVVFLFAGEDIPVFLLTVFAKNEKANLNPRERTVLIEAAKQMVEGL